MLMKASVKAENPIEMVQQIYCRSFSYDNQNTDRRDAKKSRHSQSARTTINTPTLFQGISMATTKKKTRVCKHWELRVVGQQRGIRLRFETRACPVLRYEVHSLH